MAFHEVQFPTDIAYGSVGGPGFNTNVIVTDSGAEERIARWSDARHRYNAAYGIRTHDQLNAVKVFYYARSGVANGFRYKDFHDFTSSLNGRDTELATDVTIGTGDASATTFQLIKTYISSPTTASRVITKPIAGTILIEVNDVAQTDGADYTINATTGIVTFTTVPGAGHEITAGFQFDVPVRFGEEIDSLLAMNYETFGSGGILDIPLIEIVNEEPVDDLFYFGGAATPVSVGADITITQIDGRVQRLDANGSGHKIFLPDETNLKLGGPYFYIQNPDTTDSLSLRTSADVAVATIAKSPDVGSSIVVVLGLNASSVKTWYVF